MTPANPGAGGVSSDKSRSRICRVLLADDDDDFRLALRACIEQDRCFHLNEARDGNEALALALTDTPDVLVLDHRMPGLTGSEVASRVLASRREVIVVFITAASRVREIAAAAGVHLFLGKPFGCDEFMTLLRRAAAECRLA